MIDPRCFNEFLYSLLIIVNLEVNSDSGPRHQFFITVTPLVRVRYANWGDNNNDFFRFNTCYIIRAGPPLQL